MNMVNIIPAYQHASIRAPLWLRTASQQHGGTLFILLTFIFLPQHRRLSQPTWWPRPSPQKRLCSGADVGDQRGRTVSLWVQKTRPLETSNPAPAQPARRGRDAGGSTRPSHARRSKPHPRAGSWSCVSSVQMRSTTRTMDGKETRWDLKFDFYMLFAVKRFLNFIVSCLQAIFALHDEGQYGPQATFPPHHPRLGQLPFLWWRLVPVHYVGQPPPHTHTYTHTHTHPLSCQIFTSFIQA